ncbi:glycosyltransferase family 25 protein [Rhodopseudomonas palustris]|uniref:glycosyltransferase family 25 protein n=1 Tax=Rhodopseudomonas palustris TaxID=1076 RepID=UPI000E5AD432|nr:glycosyltransferase family 25 protein [Rhodopseudomonas palustris]QLH72370.1 glycosyltransferase family 25 protein [Rhodopseudomonas palustris]RHZ95376.1 glycosyl transferase [Rhodopseudomonas palustris]WBU28532.1 glycosyltransferase family 25 protein [Rhodopseudomonas palustris]
MNPSVKIVVLSLPTATARRSQMSAMLGNTSLDWQYFDAHASLMCPNLHYDGAELRRHFGRNLSPPEIAVCSSHAAILQEFVDRNQADYILVLEDDVIFDTDFPLDQFCAFCASNGLEYVRLFGKHYAKAVHLGFFYDRSIVRFTTSPAGAQAYLMSRMAARRFLDSYRSIRATVDLAMDSFWITQLPIYSIFPYPIIERFSPTSIPMPPHTVEVRGLEHAIWQGARVVNKAKKILTNAKLRKSDESLRQRHWQFRQVGRVDVEQRRDP